MKHPPRLADRLLRFFLSDDRLEEVMGDLQEEFAWQVRRVGERRARWRYWWDVLGFLKPWTIKQNAYKYPTPTNTTMLRNYLKIAFRNLARNKGYSAINIGGLAVGMAVAILNGLWIWDELSFNKYHQNYDRIAQVVKSQTHKGEFGVGQTMVYPLATELKTNYSSHFKHLVRASSVREFILSTNENKLSSTGQFMDSDAPDMLSLNMIYGTRAGLSGPNTIMLSAKTAQGLFGEANPLGKVISLNNKTQVK